ncbi:MAG: heavy-metal-associated domain-containing protein [Micromonosporaceae bacterium]
MITQEYVVKGMTCGHCVGAVSTEVGKLPGVGDVAVDLATGTVSVTSAEPLTDGAVRDAVDEAGYELVSN